MFDFDSAAPPSQAWGRKLNNLCSKLKEFSVTFRGEKIGSAWYTSMVICKGRSILWKGNFLNLIRYMGTVAPIDPFTRERCKASASQGVPLGGMGISRGFRGEFRQFQILPGACETSPIMATQFSLVNTGKERAQVSLLFTWANLIGGVLHLSGDHVNEPFMRRLLLHHKQVIKPY
ncbi:hypothetical protein K7X08_004580 [Anisodus acutangulus]|uniref:Glycosyl-hydrolase family 116 N-terminal domain-containing protein n=1 Tax=Anisodus acutangulus TaxID=402998 RepID=A0A9Q1MHF9_9SOLA|nr:hypothetical protein K7X08_004580 [Anisodus acutangulus]